ncbi:MAG: cupin domain-containing protein [Bdellovibrionales bacterium]
MQDVSMLNQEVRNIVNYLNLSPHPEGGYFSENYRSDLVIPKENLSGDYDGDRNASTAIYFLLPKAHKSHFHRVRSDEAWHFYLGGPCTIVQLFDDGRIESVVMGKDIMEGEQLQYVVPANCWFGAFPNEEVEYSLVGCTVAPGFDYSDFELGRRAQLLEMFPQHKALIEDLSLE